MARRGFPSEWGKLAKWPISRCFEGRDSGGPGRGGPIYACETVWEKKQTAAWHSSRGSPMSASASAAHLLVNSASPCPCLARPASRPVHALACSGASGRAPFLTRLPGGTPLRFFAVFSQNTSPRGPSRPNNHRPFSVSPSKTLTFLPPGKLSPLEWKSPPHHYSRPPASLRPPLSSRVGAMNSHRGVSSPHVNAHPLLAANTPGVSRTVAVGSPLSVSSHPHPVTHTPQVIKV
jgi:hypothetical protein